jgi:hypothetical protein
MNMTGGIDKLSWTNVRDYLVSRGFRLLPTEWTDAGVFRNGEVEVIVPFDSTFADYPEALARAARQIARFEGREIADVIADLASTVRFAMHSRSCRGRCARLRRLWKTCMWGASSS